MKKNNIILAVFLSLFLFSCEFYKPKYRDAYKKVDYDGAIDKTFFFIGDAGYASPDQNTKGILLLESYLQENNPADGYMLFLGDNIYPAGMPSKKETSRKQSEHRINNQINLAKTFKGESFFIPGNHDWYIDGVKGVQRQEKYIEKALGGRDAFRPTGGCAIESVKVNEEIQLLLVDTQWYLEDWDEHPTINDNCPEIKSRDSFFAEFESQLKKYQEKTIVVALHHPLYSNGIHGGKYALKRHLYPGKSKIPMPILGSLAMQLRTTGGVSSQDIQNKKYKYLARRLGALASDIDRVIFVSGHEHSLQYIEHDKVKQIIAGSGSKVTYAGLRNDGLFAYAGDGFARLDIYKDGASWVSFYGDNGTGSATLLYKKEVYRKKEKHTHELATNFPKTKKASIYNFEGTERTGFYKSIWGEHYRALYGKEIEAPVAVLDTLYGGLKVIRKGGGHQTRSLRLEDKDGKQYSLRALKKSGVQFLQANAFKDKYVEHELENTISEDVLQDFYTSAHPYVFTMIPELSDAVGVYHSNPKVFYLPKQKALGKYNLHYGDELCTIEERPEKKQKNVASFGYPDNIRSTADVYERLRKDEKYKIDEPAFIKARMFDMLIGDWDRHQDQWRWSEFKQENGDRIYRPIPRDRDQAFSNFDGAFISAVKGMVGMFNKFQVYDEKPRSVKWLNISGLKLDRTFIQSSGREEWIKQAKYIQEHLTDSIIEVAFDKLPPVAKGASAEDIKRKLKGRKKILHTIADQYYDYLSTLEIITGTDKDDFIDIERRKNGETKIGVYRIKNGEKSDLVSQRIYRKKDTKEIWIYGLDDEDVFHVHGKGNNLIYIRIIGGQNNDKYRIENGKRLTVYDHKTKKNTLEKKGGATIRFTDDYEVNSFDKNKEIAKINTLTPGVGYNPDDGINIGFANSFQVKGFNRNPFTTKHTVKAGYYFATNGFDISYEGQFAGVLGKYNLLIGGFFTSPNFSKNFFGMGNETINNDEVLEMDFNRVKISKLGVEAGAVKTGEYGGYFSYKAIFEGIEVDKIENRFIGNPVFEAIDPEFYDRKYFLSADGIYKYESYDVVVNPTNGMKFEINVGGTAHVDDWNKGFVYIKPYLGFYNAISRNRKLVLKTIAQGQVNLGKDYEFYQSAQLGQTTGMRGYRNQRFSGQRSLATTMDLRYSFNQFKTRVAPLQFGIFAGVDVGRVWVDDSDYSDKWHNDYGGGFWISSLDMLSGTVNLFNGAEGLRFSFGFGLKI
ncbi:phosphoesterase [Aquimarina sp. TRL1]|uniref:metallophosphoesterase n=1 Tax=Aquimarina sp. (strain TRL1) TaxID=2736252 RepID=UPI00158B7B74|nr:metallophosphoesterase [Aquimarina sp. TRL1]QKX07232.1 phosphoesterase [Aquimarina sp. TRL1]